MAKVPAGIVFVDIHPDDIRLRRVDQMRTVERQGTVWARAPGPNSIWVIPDDQPQDCVHVRMPTQRQRDEGILPKRVDGPVQIPWKKARKKKGVQ